MFKISYPFFSSSLFAPFTLLLVLFSPSVFSHGAHYEIQLKSELQVNINNQISGVGMIWTYDPLISADMLKDEPNMKKLEKSIHSNLERFNFFTKIKAENKPLTTGKAQNFKLEKIHKGNVNNLQISFTLPFVSPPALGNIKKLTFDYSDPTTTAILYYAEPQDISLGSGLENKCKTHFEEKPSFKEGEFPQNVSITCH